MIYFYSVTQSSLYSIRLILWHNDELVICLHIAIFTIEWRTQISSDSSVSSLSLNMLGVGVIARIWSCRHGETFCNRVGPAVACLNDDAGAQTKQDSHQFHIQGNLRLCPLSSTACSRVSTSWTCVTRGPARTMRWTATKPRPLSWNPSHYPADPTSQSSTKYPPCTLRYVFRIHRVQRLEWDGFIYPTALRKPQTTAPTLWNREWEWHERKFGERRKLSLTSPQYRKKKKKVILLTHTFLTVLCD